MNGTDNASSGRSRHDRNLEVLREIAVRSRRGELPPTAREAAAISGYKSSKSGQRILADLEEEGFIERPHTPTNHRRPVSITERGWLVIGESTVMGRIAAGRGLEAIADEEAYSVAGELLVSRSGRQRYLLRVVGQSMVDARIHDGDLLVVEADEDPPDGAIVVALLAEDEVTVKRLYRKNSHVLLVAESPNHADIEVGWGEVEVRGRVVYVIHATT